MKFSIIRRLTMPLPELEAHYRSRRAEQFRKNMPIKGIRARAKIHWLIVGLLKLNRVVHRQKLIVLHDRRKKAEAGRPVIYAVTHIGRYDIEMALELIKAPCYFFMGDPGNTYRNFDGIVLFLNGTIFTDTDHKEDRHIGKETCVKLLQQGGDLLIFPEGAWNIVSNQVVMSLFTGTAEMAIRTGAEIVPIAIEQQGRNYYANVGENLDLSAYGLENKRQATDVLRDVLCTLKWELWERFPLCGRAGLPEDAAERFLDSIMSETENGYTVEAIERSRYHSREELAQQDAFAHLDQLIPSRANAFLFRKK